MSLRLLSTFIALPISLPDSPPPPATRYWAVLLWPALLGTQATTIAFRLARLCCSAVTYPSLYWLAIAIITAWTSYHLHLTSLLLKHDIKSTLPGWVCGRRYFDTNETGHVDDFSTHLVRIMFKIFNIQIIFPNKFCILFYLKLT